MKKNVSLIIILLTLFSCSNKQIKKQEFNNTNNKNENSVIKHILSLKQKSPAFEFKIWTDKKKYQVGENLDIYVKSTKDCYVTIIDITTSGKAYVIYPNKYSKDNFIKTGEKIQISGKNKGFKINVGGPKGTERLKAIASLKPLKLFNMNSNDTFHQIDLKNKNAYRGDNSLEKKLKSHVWVDSICEIEIQPNPYKKRGLKEEEGKSMPKPIPSAGTEEIWDTSKPEVDGQKDGE